MTTERDHIMQFFQFAHLPLPVQGFSQPFGDMAEWITVTIPRNPERTVALRKLLEAKDACVRAALAKPTMAHDSEARSVSMRLEHADHAVAIALDLMQPLCTCDIKEHALFAVHENECPIGRVINAASPQPTAAT